MRLLLLSALGLAALAAPQGAQAQLVEDQMEGSQRLCLYRSGPLTDGGRTLRVGAGDSCPSYFPVRNTSVSPPPTARLTANEIDENGRVCRYTQRGTEWQLHVPLNGQCPLAAGILLQQQAANAEGGGKRRAFTPPR